MAPVRRAWARLLISALLFGAAPASAAAPADLADVQLADAAAERRARALMETLRCIQCQGQSIADSDAPIARTMRAEVRRRIAAGQGAADIRAFLVDRYGRWVSYDPPADALGWPLYALPVLVLAGGLAVAARLFRRRTV